MAQSDDPIRDEVERALHAVLGTVIALPLATALAVRRCIGRRVAGVRRRMTEPAAVVRSMFELVGSPRSLAGSTTELVPPAAPDVAAEADALPTPSPRRGADELPIEEYQSLAASQVVARLPALTAEELGEVRRFEAAHRGRRTVLGRIDQLLVPS